MPNSFKLERYTEATQPAVSVCDLKAQIVIDDDSYNDLLESFEESARRYLESVTGKVFASETYDLYLDSFPDDSFNFSHGPVTSITSIAYLVSGSYTTIDSTLYTLGRGKSVTQGVYLKYGKTWPSLSDVVPDAVRIRYVVGEPNKIGNQAIKMLVAHWFNTREAVSLGNTTNEIPFGIQALTRSLKTYKI